MSTTVSKQQNFLDGEWVDATGGETMEVLNPATGETIAEVPRSSAADVDRAVQRLPLGRYSFVPVPGTGTCPT